MDGAVVSRRRRSVLGTAVVVLLSAVVVLAGPVGAPASGAPERAAGPAPLEIRSVEVTCECGGAGYLWGWRGVWVGFDGARQGHTYRAVVKGGPTVKGEGWGIFVSRDVAGFEPGRTYRFKVEELKRRQVTRSTGWTRYRIPEPVAHPTGAHLDSVSVGEDEVMVAGETYRITFDGEWGPGTRFASGVDRYSGTAPGDDRFGYYEEAGYPLPWESRGTEPIVELTPTADMVGTTWSILVVGYRPAAEADRSAGIRKGDPVPGSEWGFWWSVQIVAAGTAGR